MICKYGAFDIREIYDLKHSFLICKCFSVIIGIYFKETIIFLKHSRTKQQVWSLLDYASKCLQKQQAQNNKTRKDTELFIECGHIERSQACH